MDLAVLADKLERSQFGIACSSDEITAIVAALRAAPPSSERAVTLLREVSTLLGEVPSRYVSGWELSDMKARIDAYTATMPQQGGKEKP